MLRSIAVFAVAAALAAPAFAHEGHAHKLTGVVKAVHADASHVELEAKDGKPQGFYVSAATKYRHGSKAASLADLKPGTRVVVTGKTEGERLVATEVKLGAAKSAPAAHKH